MFVGQGGGPVEEHQCLYVDSIHIVIKPVDLNCHTNHLKAPPLLANHYPAT